MAKIIQKRADQCEKMLIRISWKESAQIYCHSVLIMFYICLVNLLSLFKFYFDTRVKQKIMKQLWSFSSSRDNHFDRQKSVKRRVKNIGTRSVSPLTLTCAKLGAHNYIRINSIRMHYIESGKNNTNESNSYNVILLLHGFPDCFFSWRHQIGALSQDHRVIALDLKGFNDSDKPLMLHHYKPERICYEMKQFLDAINAKFVTIIGHDLGAIVGWIFAFLYPDYVDKFISISTPHPNLYWSSGKGKWLSKYWFNMIQIPLLPEKELNNGFIREAYSHLMDEMSNEISHGEENFKKDNLIETYEYIFGRSSDWTGALNYFRNFLFYRIPQSHTLKCPCLIIFGTDNQHFKLESAIKSAEYCENPLIKIIDGAGYFAHQTNPTELNAILLKYLVGEKNNNEQSDDEGRKSLMTRVMNKVYSVGQQYSMNASNKWINYSSS